MCSLWRSTPPGGRRAAKSCRWASLRLGVEALLALVLLLAASASARGQGPVKASGIIVTASDAGKGRLQIGYQVTAGPGGPARISLVVELAAGATVEAETSVLLVDPTFALFPDGSPLANPEAPGPALLPASRFTISLASSAPFTPPALSPLVLLQLAPGKSAATAVTISEDRLRGGIVDSLGWARREPNSSPSPRSDHAMVYDQAHENVVLFGGLAEEAGPGGGASFRRADANADGGVDIGDSLRTFFFLFVDWTAPSCMDAADANDDGSVDLMDGIHTLSFLYRHGPPPPGPGPGSCGPDLVADDELPECEYPPELCGLDAGPFVSDETWLWESTNWRLVPVEMRPPAGGTPWPTTVLEARSFSSGAPTGTATCSMTPGAGTERSGPR
jgi:hypothetical protein